MATKKSAPKQEFKIIKKTKKLFVKKTDIKTVTVGSARRPRKIQQAEHKSFKLSKRIKHYNRPIAGPITLTKYTFRPFIKHWRLYAGIVLVYLVLNVIFVHGFGSGIDLAALKESIQNNKAADQGNFATATTLFSYLLTSNGGSSAGTGLFQTLLVLLVSLSIIWTLRQITVESKIRIRDAFYKSTGQLIPFILVLSVVALQLIPLIAANWLITNIIGGGIASAAVERFVTYIIAGLFTLLSLYMLSSSLFALYIVTLPDMTPFKALKGARKLVMHRRWTIMRKIIFLPFLLIITGAAIMLPMLLLLPSFASWMYFVLSLLIPFVIHSYMYSLYRELL